MRRYSPRLKEDISFEQFLWESARSFLLESPYETTEVWISEEECPYGIVSLRESLTAAHQELTRLQRMTSLEFLDERRAQDEAQRALLLEQSKELAPWRANCVHLLKRVQAWEPPTVDHHMLKHLMIQQLQDAIQETMDGTPKVTLTIEVAPRLHREAIFKAREKTESIAQSLSAATEKLKWRNAWVRALHSAVPQPVEDEET